MSAVFLSCYFQPQSEVFLNAVITALSRPCPPLYMALRNTSAPSEFSPAVTFQTHLLSPHFKCNHKRVTRYHYLCLLVSFCCCLCNAKWNPFLLRFAQSSGWTYWAHEEEIDRQCCLVCWSMSVPTTPYGIEILVARPSLCIAGLHNQSVPREPL